MSTPWSTPSKPNTTRATSRQPTRSRCSATANRLSSPRWRNRNSPPKIPLEDLRFVLIGDAAADPPSGPTGLLDTWGATPFGQALDHFLGWSNLDDVTTPSDLYPTDVFTVVNDFFADTATPADFAANPLGALWQDFVGFFEHGVYLGGLPESEILTAIDGGGVMDGATTYFALADPVNLLEALWDTTLGSFGIAVP